MCRLAAISDFGGALKRRMRAPFGGALWRLGVCNERRGAGRARRMSTCPAPQGKRAAARHRSYRDA
ncbi:hypothetical protein BLAT2472_50007 [Burkholderia latens]